MMEVARTTPGVTLVDARRYFCDDERCHAVIGGVVVYADAHHLTETYATTLGRLIGPEIAGTATGDKP